MRSTARRRLPMLNPASRRVRFASTLVRRSSRNSTGQGNRRPSFSTNSATCCDMAVSPPLWPRGFPTSTRPTEYSTTSECRCSKSSAMRVRWSVGRPWAVIPRASETARPMRLVPKSIARIRGFTVTCACLLLSAAFPAEVPQWPRERRLDLIIHPTSKTTGGRPRRHPPEAMLASPSRSSSESHFGCGGIGKPLQLLTVGFTA